MKGWKKIKSKIVHQNPWYAVHEHDVIQPNGSRGKFFVLATAGSIAVVAEDIDGKIYLVGQHRYAVGNQFSWEIVIGALKKGKSPLQTAKEELEEEVGVKAKNWKKIGTIHAWNGLSAEVCHVFLAKDLIQSKQDLDETEDISVKKVDLEKILAMIKNNKITSSLTISAILKYLLFKKL